MSHLLRRLRNFPALYLRRRCQNARSAGKILCWFFAVSVLAEDAPLSLIGQFGFKSGRDVDKFEGIPYKLTGNGLPYLIDHMLAYLEARVVQEVDAGTHTIFIGELTEAEVLRDGNPLTYAYYHQLKRGSASPTASSDIQERKETVNMAKYECTVSTREREPWCVAASRWSYKWRIRWMPARRNTCQCSKR